MLRNCAQILRVSSSYFINTPYIRSVSLSKSIKFHITFSTERLLSSKKIMVHQSLQNDVMKCLCKNSIYLQNNITVKDIIHIICIIDYTNQKNNNTEVI